MPLGYQTPGVRVTEIPNASLTAAVGTPTFICVIGTATGSQKATDKVTLPAQTTSVGIQILPTGTFNVVSTNDFPTSGTFAVGGQTVTYTGKTATSFTGCTGGTGTQAAGLVVSVDVPVTLANTGVIASTVVVKRADTLAVINPGNYNIAQSADPNTTVTGDELYTIARVSSPTAVATNVIGSAGNPSGTYVYAYSWVTAAGETGLSPDSASVSPSAQQVTVTLPANSAGPTGTSGKNVYRKRTTGDNSYHMVGTTASTTFSDNILNSAAEISAAQGQIGGTPYTGLNIGDNLFVAYSYTNQNYYLPTLFDNFSDIVQKYGEPFDAAGNISSTLSYGARLVLSNGAGEVVCLASPAMDASTFGTTLDKLKSEDDIGIIVPIDGSPANHAAVQAHCQYMATQGFLRMGIVGQDSSTANITMATLRTAAQGFNGQEITMIAPASFKIQNPVNGRFVAIGSQYMAAAVAGMCGARDPWVPLTRKVVAGFATSNERRSSVDKINDAASGLLLIEEKAPGVLRVMQGITTSTTSVNTKELSVVRAKFALATTMREGLDTLVGFAGNITSTPMIVHAKTTAILDQLRNQGLISAFGGVNARLLNADPTTCEVRFQYTPIYPLNNIEIQFTLNTASGLFSLVTQ